MSGFRMRASGFRRGAATMVKWLLAKANPIAVLAGMSFLAAAAFQVNEALGLATVGASLIAAGVEIKGLRS